GLVMLAWLIEIDAPGRRLHFLATRPVPWNVLLAEKAVFAAVFLLLPVWIAKMGTVFLLRIPVNATDVTLILVENTIRMAALMSAVALFASFFRNLWVVFLAMLGASALVLVGVVF
ncbi:MAG TPA: hypothetical protein VG733_09460, partial [Chthoniobacteraceae bacterium]|nr:hypothetical protein [Chthoniobacteraceae bacterium]